MVVSLVPNFNRALGESLKRVLPGAPLVTILTDIADYPPHFWMERQDQHFICGSDQAVEQALALGHPETKVHRVSGMILNPRSMIWSRSGRRSARRRAPVWDSIRSCRWGWSCSAARARLPCSKSPGAYRTGNWC